MLLDDDLRTRCEQLERSLREERTFSGQLKEANAMLQAAVNELCDRYKSLSVQCAARIKELEEQVLNTEGGDDELESEAIALEKSSKRLENENRELRLHVSDLEQQLANQDLALHEVYRRTGPLPQLTSSSAQTISSYMADLRRSAALIDFKENSGSPSRRRSAGKEDGGEEGKGDEESYRSLDGIKAAVKELEHLNCERGPLLPTLPTLRLVASIDPDASPTLRLMRAMHFATKTGDRSSSRTGEMSTEEVLNEARMQQSYLNNARLSARRNRGDISPQIDVGQTTAIGQLERLVKGACAFNQQLIDRADRSSVLFEFMSSPSRRVKKRDLALLAIAVETSDRTSAI